MWDRPGVAVGYHATTIALATVSVTCSALLSVLCWRELRRPAKSTSSSGNSGANLHRVMRTFGFLYAVLLTAFLVDPYRVYHIYHAYVSNVIMAFIEVLVSGLCQFIAYCSTAVLRKAVNYGTTTGLRRVLASIISVMTVVKLTFALVSAHQDSDHWVAIGTVASGALNLLFVVVWLGGVLRLRAFVKENEKRLGGSAPGTAGAGAGAAGGSIAASAQLRRFVIISIVGSTTLLVGSTVGIVTSASALRSPPVPIDAEPGVYRFPTRLVLFTVGCILFTLYTVPSGYAASNSPQPSPAQPRAQDRDRVGAPRVAFAAAPPPLASRPPSHSARGGSSSSAMPMTVKPPSPARSRAQPQQLPQLQPLPAKTPQSAATSSASAAAAVAVAPLSTDIAPATACVSGEQSSASQHGEAAPAKASFLVDIRVA